MSITIRFFATLRDKVGTADSTLEIQQPTSVRAVVQEIARLHPTVAESVTTAIVAVNHEYAFPDDLVNPGDELALFPPVSGGMHEVTFPEHLAVTSQKLDLDNIIALITIPQTGAVCVFAGTVRGSTQFGSDFKRTDQLLYEAYEPMASEKLKQVALEMRERYPKIQGVAIVQRIGTLEVGETTILVACSAGHRNDGCFEAAKYGIDRVKEIVPIWKKEIGDTQSWVEGHYRPTPIDAQRKAAIESKRGEGVVRPVKIENLFIISCQNCGERYDIENIPAFCECGGILEMVGYPPFHPGLISSDQYSIWRYKSFLVPSEISPVTLGEGWTPLITAHAYGMSIYLKTENLNPTGSFKDRGASVIISTAVNGGKTRVHDDSSGNAGAALAAYAARAKLSATLYVPESIPEAKLAHIASYGAAVHRIPGPRSEVAAAAQEEAANHDSYYASHVCHPFAIPAYKTIAYELWEQLGKTIPDIMVVPVGQGTLLLGLSRGFKDILASGLADRCPQIIGVQASNCAPIWEEFHHSPNGSPRTSTLADGIQINDPIHHSEVVKAIRDSNGDLITVDETSIIGGIRGLADCGISAEPTSAVVWAALPQLRDRVEKSTKLVLVITGSGLKYASASKAGSS